LGLKPTFSVDFPEQCAPAKFNLMNTMDPSVIQSSIWRFSDGGIFVNQNQITYATDQIGNYGFKLIVTTKDGCKDSITVTDTLKVSKKPIANFTFSKSSDDSNFSEYQLENNSLGANEYQWDMSGVYTGNTTIENPSFLFNDSLTGEVLVRLIAKSGGFCMDSTSQIIQMKPTLLLYTPNSFSPNGDGINDVWKYSMVGYSSKDFEISIYDRWGAMVWKSYDSSETWNGMYKSLKLPIGTYTWTMILKDAVNDKKYFEKGAINIIR
jgi:gliding motility-associated-like protein